MHIHVHHIKWFEVSRLLALVCPGLSGVSLSTPGALPDRVSRIFELRLGRSSLEPNEPAVDRFDQPVIGHVSEFPVKFLGVILVQRTRCLVSCRSTILTVE